MGEIRRARIDEAAEVGAILGQAFANDPVMSWALPGPAHQRQPLLEDQFTLLARHGYLAHGASWLIEDRAAALWLPSGVTLGPAFWEQHGADFVAAVQGRTERLSALGEAMRAHHPDEAHRYLFAIGARTPGQGLGGRLLGAALAEADAAGEAAYLEATSERSRALYERHGFVARGELRVDDSPPLWPMWRDPSPG